MDAKRKAELRKTYSYNTVVGELLEALDAAEERAEKTPTQAADCILRAIDEIRSLRAERDRLRDQANDWHKVADDRAAEIVRLRESLEAEISKAFDAGAAYSVGSHRDFKQIHPNRKEYVRQVLNRPECREVGDGR